MKSLQQLRADCGCSSRQGLYALIATWKSTRSRAEISIETGLPVYNVVKCAS